MSTTDSTLRRHVIAALVTNEPGVLAQVAGMFAARGFNIDSLVVGRTENPELSRMTIVVVANDLTLEQCRKQLSKLVPVVKVVDFADTAFVERDLVLVKVATADGDNPSARRAEVVQLAGLFRAKIVDVATDCVMVELSGTEEKVEAFLDLVAPLGIVEMARTGLIAMPRGRAGASKFVRGGRTVSAKAENDMGVDPSSLPPG